MNTAPRRLLDDPSLGLYEKNLLRSFAHEQPSSAARERAMSLAPLAATAAALAIAPTLIAGSVAPAKAAAGLFGLSKLTLILSMLGVLVLVTAGTGTITMLARKSAAAPMHANAPSSPTTTSPPALIASSSVTESSTTPLTDVTSLPNATTARAVATSTTASAPPRAIASTNLAEQVTSVDQVRAAIASHDNARALSLVDDYEHRFPHGAFREEAEALRIEALAANGQKAAAERAANRFFATYPTSPHSERIRALLQQHHAP